MRVSQTVYSRARGLNLPALASVSRIFFGMVLPSPASTGATALTASRTAASER